MWLRVSRTQQKMFQSFWINWRLLEEGQFPLLAFLVTARDHPAWVSTHPYHQGPCGRGILRMACLLNSASQVIDILMPSSSCGISSSVCHWTVTMTVTINTLTNSAPIITALSLISCKLIQEMPISPPSEPREVDVISNSKVRKQVQRSQEISWKYSASEH